MFPEYAGGHHERMDGKAIHVVSQKIKCRCKPASWRSPIFSKPYRRAILTSRDLSPSLNILGNFSLNGHIDPELFHVFVKEKVYLEYARKFMDPSQIDEVDESKIPGYVNN